MFHEKIECRELVITDKGGCQRVKLAVVDGRARISLCDAGGSERNRIVAREHAGGALTMIDPSLPGDLTDQIVAELSVHPSLGNSLVLSGRPGRSVCLQGGEQRLASELPKLIVEGDSYERIEVTPKGATAFKAGVEPLDDGRPMEIAAGTSEDDGAESEVGRG